MLKVSSNIPEIVGRLQGKIDSLNNVGANNDKVMRAIATAALSEIVVRIHKRGENSSGAAIGTYSNSYLKRRQRKPFNRTSDNKVIFSLTRQMERDTSVIEQGTGRYGIGFKNSVNAEKAEWLQQRFGKVYSLTAKERNTLKAKANEIIDELFNK